MWSEVGGLSEQARQQRWHLDPHLQHLHGSVEEQVQALRTPQSHRRPASTQHLAHRPQLLPRPTRVERRCESVPEHMHLAMIVDQPDRHPIAGRVHVEQPTEQGGHG